MNSKPSPEPTAPRPQEFTPPRSLHADCETWTDTCSCEPEPRWQALADELESQTPAPAATRRAEP